MFFACQKKEPEPTQKIGSGSSSNFKSASAPAKKTSAPTGSGSATMLAVMIKKNFLLRCGICGSSLLFSFTQIGYHVNKNHSMTIADYRARFLSTTTPAASSTSAAAPKSSLAATSSLSAASASSTKNGTDTAANNSVVERVEKAASDSNGFGDGMCLARCKICHQEIDHHMIRSHLQYEHSVIETYWEKYEFSRKTFYT